MTKENGLKLIEFMPQTVPVDGVIKVFYHLEKMEEEPGFSELDWECLKKEMDSW